MPCCGGSFDNATLAKQIEEQSQVLEDSTLWNEHARMRVELQKKASLEKKYARNLALQRAMSDVEDYLSFAEQGDKEALHMLSESIEHAEKILQSVELSFLFTQEEDSAPALLELHAGAGGTEAQDWVSMLVRMYENYAQKEGFSVSCLDFLPGNETGIKSITLRIEGENAYGFFKYEAGIHRLIRISPFDASGKRHTSFASVDVLPDIETSIAIDIQEGDLRIETFRSSGPGGQSVNTTSSAVRITHIPTGVVAQCQNEKSQHANRDSAMKILKARLYKLEQERIASQKQENYNTKSAINFGSQIRTYTLHPYKLVKDHRTNVEIPQAEQVLDGNLHELIRSCLLYYSEH